jgi:subtilisin family serine protease
VPFQDRGGAVSTTEEFPPVPIRRSLALAATAALAVTAVGATAGTAAAAPSSGSPLGSYIFTVAHGNAPSQVAGLAAARLGGRVGYVYTAALNGFSVTVPAALADRLSALPGVVAVEQDQPVEASDVESPTPSWGLDRIDAGTGATATLDSSYHYTATGAGVTAYIIDTGIQLSNADFTGRVFSGDDEIDGGTADDCNGHGTHVAGTVGGTRYGVAKQVNLVAVRVLDCSGSGSTSGVIAGVDWVTNNHTALAVANMSLGGGASSALDTAVANSISSGVTYSVAAGNGNTAGVPQDACKSSPARVPSALTVGATDNKDAATSWSNYGSCVDLFAPGLNITSDWYNAASNTISGTSMATPHVTGVAALYLQGHSAASPDAVSSAIKSTATPHIVKTSGRYKTANNNLLYSLIP